MPPRKRKRADTAASSSTARTIALFGGALKFDLGSSGAAEIGAATGLGSKNNKDLVKKGKQAFFNWIDCTDEVATARGGGGGLALWSRTEAPTL